MAARGNNAKKKSKRRRHAKARKLAADTLASASTQRGAPAQGGRRG